MKVFILILLIFFDDIIGFDVLFCGFMNLRFPGETFLIKIIESGVWKTVWYTDVNSSRFQNTMDLIKHYRAIRPGVITTDDAVKTGFVDNCIISTVFNLIHVSDVHYFEIKLRNLFSIIFGHLIDNFLRRIYIINCFVPIFK